MCPKGTLCNVDFTGTITGVLHTSVEAGIDTYPDKRSIADGGHACPQYKYCPKGTSTAIDIPIGTMQSTFGRGDLEEAISCPPGFYTAENTDSDPTVVAA